MKLKDIPREFREYIVAEKGDRHLYMFVAPKRADIGFFLGEVRKEASLLPKIELELRPRKTRKLVTTLQPIYKQLNKYYLPRQLTTGAICGLTLLHFGVHGVLSHGAAVAIANVAWGFAFFPSAYVHGNIIARKSYAKQLLGPEKALEYINLLKVLEKEGAAVVLLDSPNFPMAKAGLFDVVRAFYHLSSSQQKAILSKA